MAAPPRPRGMVRMKCCAGMALLIPGSFGNGRDSDTLRPVRQSRAASTRFAGVIRLIVPRWSSGPHRPQLLRSRIQLRTSASVGSRRSVIAPSPCSECRRRLRPGRPPRRRPPEVLRRHVELHAVDAIASLAPGDRHPLARVGGGPAGHDQDAGGDAERPRDLGTARQDLDLPLQPAELHAGPVAQHLQQRVAHLLRLEAGGERRRHLGAIVGDHLAVDQPEQLHDGHAAPPRGAGAARAPAPGGSVFGS